MKYFVDSKKFVILQAIILRIILVPNETICNPGGTDILIEREDKKLGMERNFIQVSSSFIAGALIRDTINSN